MRNQKGFSLTELLIVVAIIGVVAAIAIPSAKRSHRFRSFERVFQVSLPLDDPLTDAQRDVLRPLVAARITSTCSSGLTAEQITRQPPSTDPRVVQQRLDELAAARERESQCAQAKAIAKREGLLAE